MQTKLVSLAWLAEHLQDENVKIVDCRFVLGQPDAGRAAYEEGHLPGAVHFDLEKDLSSQKAEHGGRHPMPDVDTLAEKLGRAGISKASRIIAYDDQGGAMASRFWWLLQYLGHEEVALLDASFKQWQAAGLPVTQEVPTPVAVVFTPQVQHDLLLKMEDVRARLNQSGVVLIDSREAKRYLGIEEPIDRVAGHIPGAVNHFWKEGLTETGAWKSPQEQQERFQAIDKEAEVIVYCGSGVTACPNIFALQEAGFRNVKLYAGSWSDWSSYPENPVAVQKEG